MRPSPRPPAAGFAEVARPPTALALGTSGERSARRRCAPFAQHVRHRGDPQLDDSDSRERTRVTASTDVGWLPRHFPNHELPALSADPPRGTETPALIENQR
jgi:hypothetical protein